MSTRSLTPIKKQLDKLLENVGDMSLKRRARLVIEELELKSGDRVLDLGCGDGYYLYLLSQLPISLKLTGVDVDKIALRSARNNLSPAAARLINSSIDNLPFHKNSFDKIIFTEVIEHVTNDSLALQTIFKILKPNGLILLTTTSYNHPLLWDPINWLLERLFQTHIKQGFWSGIWFDHTRLYVRRDLEEKVKQSGFRVEQSRELTWWCLPFNHYLVNLVARILYDLKPPGIVTKSVSKFSSSKKPFLVRLAFKIIEGLDKMNDILPQRNGVNIFIKARKVKAAR